jgi:sterol desaturase/sphingolipid hydroxylase (fatty acid hydroxylase superfamily)
MSAAAEADRVLRKLIVTPDMHRVHHSVIRRETDSNYGFNFSFWDRLFGTYRPEPEAGQTPSRSVSRNGAMSDQQGLAGRFSCRFAVSRS